MIAVRIKKKKIEKFLSGHLEQRFILKHLI